MSTKIAARTKPYQYPSAWKDKNIFSWYRDVNAAVRENIAIVWVGKIPLIACALIDTLWTFPRGGTQRRASHDNLRDWGGSYGESGPEGVGGSKVKTS